MEGVVRGIANGFTMVIAMDKNTGSSSAIFVLIEEAAEDGIVHIAITLYVGDSCSLVGFMPGMNKITPSMIDWDSSKEEIASVDEDGKVKALEKGLTLITAKDSLHEKEGKVYISVRDGSEVDEVVDENAIKQISVGLDHTLLLKNNGEVFAMGSNASGQLIDKTTASGTYSRSLGTGVYIIRVNGEVVKFIR